MPKVAFFSTFGTTIELFCILKVDDAYQLQENAAIQQIIDNKYLPFFKYKSKFLMTKKGASSMKTCPYLFCYTIFCNLSFLFLWNHNRCSDAGEQYEKDNDERSYCINLEEIVDEHLHTDEHQ